MFNFDKLTTCRSCRHQSTLKNGYNFNHQLDVIRQWGWGVKEVRGKTFLKATIHGIVWGIWKERNERIFKDKKRKCGR